MNNKKGFTLVELLAVIAILAVIMLIAVGAVLPMINKSKRNSLFDEGLALEKAAKLAFRDSSLTFTDSGKQYELSKSDGVCFDIDFLYQKGYFDKGNENGYYGSVLIEYDDDTGENFNINYNISNIGYRCLDMSKDSNVDECEKGSNSDKTDNNVIKCGNAGSYIVYCDKSGSCN